MGVRTVRLLVIGHVTQALSSTPVLHTCGVTQTSVIAHTFSYYERMKP